MNEQKKMIAGMIDHALLTPQLTDAELERGCHLADSFEVATVCVKPYHVSAAGRLLHQSVVNVSTVIDFPHGNSLLETKMHQIERAIYDGAKEMDVVLNIGKICSHDWLYIENEVKELIQMVHQTSLLIKCIFETGYLNSEEIVWCCKICNANGADFVKTSTGFGFVRQPNGCMVATGATIPNLQLMLAHSTVSQVKASGGIRDWATAWRYYEMGIKRLGTSSTATILE